MLLPYKFRVIGQIIITVAITIFLTTSLIPNPYSLWVGFSVINMLYAGGILLSVSQLKYNDEVIEKILLKNALYTLLVVFVVLVIGMNLSLFNSTIFHNSTETIDGIIGTFYVAYVPLLFIIMHYVMLVGQLKKAGFNPREIRELGILSIHDMPL